MEWGSTTWAFAGVGAAAVATSLVTLRRRLQLSMAKHASLTGHARMARWVASFVPFYAISVAIFFVSGADAASIVMGTLSERGAIEPKKPLVIFWGVLTGAVVPGMRERAWGRIVNVGSSSAREPIPGLNLSNSHRMAAVGFLKTNPKPTREELAHGISGNLCRCGDYDKILRSMMRGAAYMQKTTT